MDRYTLLLCHPVDLLEDVERNNLSGCQRLLHTDQSGRWEVDIAAVADSGSHLLCIKNPIFKVQGADKRLRQYRCSTYLVRYDVCGVRQDDLVPSLGVGHHRYCVAHGTTGNK